MKNILNHTIKSRSNIPFKIRSNIPFLFSFWDSRHNLSWIPLDDEHINWMNLVTQQFMLIDCLEEKKIENRYFLQVLSP